MYRRNTSLAKGPGLSLALLLDLTIEKIFVLEKIWDSGRSETTARLIELD